MPVFLSPCSKSLVLRPENTPPSVQSALFSHFFVPSDFMCPKVGSNFASDFKNNAIMEELIFIVLDIVELIVAVMFLIGLFISCF